MPLRLNVGVSNKLDLPAYSSVGASCNLDLELENGVLRDPAGFRDQVRGAFAAAQRAVDDELARLQAGARPAIRPSSTASPARPTPRPWPRSAWPTPTPIWKPSRSRKSHWPAARSRPRRP